MRNYESKPLTLQDHRDLHEWLAYCEEVKADGEPIMFTVPFRKQQFTFVGLDHGHNDGFFGRLW